MTGLLAAIAFPVVLVAFLAAAWIRRGPDDGLALAVLRLINEGFMRLVHRLRRRPPGRGAPVPAGGPAILAANHSSGADPLALSASTHRAVRFLMAREYYELRGLRWLFRTLRAIPVNRGGSVVGTTRAALQALVDGEAIGVFPEGGILEGRGQAVGKPGIGLLALRTGAPVIPIHIHRVPDTPRIFGAILRPSRMTVVVGEPMRFAPAGDRPTRVEIDEATRRIVGRIEELGRGDG